MSTDDLLRECRDELTAVRQQLLDLQTALAAAQGTRGLSADEIGRLVSLVATYGAGRDETLLEKLRALRDA